MVTYTFTNGTVADADEVNQNFTDVEEMAAKFAQVPYSTLKAVGSWTNEGNLAADRFTDVASVNNTVDTASSTMIYSTGKYTLSIADEASGDTTHNPDGASNPENAFDGNSNSAASGIIADFNLGKTFSSKTISYVRVKARVTLSGFTKTIRLQTYDGSTWTTFQTLISSGGTVVEYNDIVFLNQTCQGVRVSIGTPSSSSSHEIYLLQYGDYNTSSTLICNQNLLTLTGNETNISLHNSATTPTNTSMKVTLNDGVQDISAETTLSENDSTLIPLTATPTAGNTLELHYTLETTDNTVTPEFYGYGVMKK